jgi:hypothetical protein
MHIERVSRNQNNITKYLYKATLPKKTYYKLINPSGEVIAGCRRLRGQHCLEARKVKQGVVLIIYPRRKNETSITAVRCSACE